MSLDGERAYSDGYSRFIDGCRVLHYVLFRHQVELLGRPLEGAHHFCGVLCVLCDDFAVSDDLLMS